MKINKLIAQGTNLVTFSLLLPFIYGCNGGGGSSGSASLGSLFGNSGNPGGVPGLLNPLNSGNGGVETLGTVGTVGGVVDPGTVLAAVHNPEPATLFLLGSGMAAIGLIYKKKQLGR